MRSINFEFDFPTKQFAQTRFALEIRPIIGWRNPDWQFIANPIVDIGFGTFGDIDLAPAARLARKLGEDFYLGLEYYTDLGRPDHFFPFEQQAHQLFGVVDFKVGEIEVDFGAIVSMSSRGVGARRRASGAAPAPAREHAVALRLRKRARLSIHDGRLCPDDRAGCRCRGPWAEGASSHAPPCLRLRARQPGPRHPGNPGVARPPVDHEHCGLHDLGAEPVQGFLAGLSHPPRAAEVYKGRPGRS
jgi:hypothetical protein